MLTTANENQPESLVEQLGEWLRERRPAARWAILLIATIVATLFDFGTYQQQLSMAALYLAPVTIACWTLSARQAVLFTIGVAIVAGLRYPMFNPDPDFWTGLNNNVGRVISFGVNAAVVLGLKRSHDRLAYLATHDPLTGVYNRKAFEDELRLLLSDKMEPRRPLLLAYVDLDGFKAVNDQHGHAAGDQVLTAFAASANSLLSNGQIAGRLGGDEFAIAVSVADHSEAIRVAQDLHMKFTAALASSGYPVGCSVGALFIEATDDRSAEQLIIAGDNLMYAAKHAGKGKVQLSMAPHATRSSAGRELEEAAANVIRI
jgi:diguanylate cyclase (GGDEF)-like protein